MVLLWIESRWTTKNWFDLLNLDLSLYDLQVGEPLLTPSLGFPSMESLLRSLPDVCTLRYSGGQLVVMGVASSATAHVQDMVAKQNTARRGKKRGGGVGGAICRGRSERGAAGQYTTVQGGVVEDSKPPMPVEASVGLLMEMGVKHIVERVEGGVVENSVEALGVESPYFRRA